MKRAFFLAGTAAVAIVPTLPIKTYRVTGMATVYKPSGVMGLDSKYIKIVIDASKNFTMEEWLKDETRTRT